MNKYKPKFNYDERDRNNINKYSEHKAYYSSEECDLSQKIKNLELEGLKLRNQVESILQETNEDYTSRTGESMNDCDSLNTNTDQNGTYDQIYSRENIMKANHKSHDSKQMKDHSTRDNITSLQNELEECRQNLDFMHQKLKQENYAHQKEKEEILLSMENLKRSNLKLKTTCERQIQDIKSRERKQESVIECLRSNLNQLLNVNQRQEELLVESGKRLIEAENIQTELKAFDNLRDLLIEIEYHNCSDFLKDYDLQSCSYNNMIEIVDKYVKELNSGLDERGRKIRQLEDDMLSLKRNLLHDKEKSIMELKNQITYAEEQNGYLKRHINEINENCDREISRMKDETMMIKSKMDNEMSNATSVIDGLENNLQQLSNKLKRENETWILEKKSLEKLLDDNEKQMAVIRVERDQALSQKSSLLAKLDATQNKLSETETQLLQLESDKYSQDKQIDNLNKRNKAVENSLSYTRAYLENITKSIRTSSFRGDGMESNNNDANKNNLLLDLEASEEDNIPWRPRKFEMEEMLHEIKVMNKRKIEAEEKLDHFKSEFSSVEKQLDSNKIENKKLEQNLKAQQLEMDSLKNENSHINSLIANRNGEIERLTAERDYYFQMLNEKTEDLANVKTEKHRLIVLLEERCRKLEMQSHSSNNSNQNNESGNKLIDTSNGKNQVLREERNRLTIQLNELQNTREKLLTNQKDQTICMDNIRSENAQLQLELKNIYRDYDKLLAENKRLLIKMKECDSEIAGLCQELQQCKAVKSRKHLNMEKKFCDLNTELSSYKNELKIAQDRIKGMEKLGSKSNINSQPLILNDLNKSTVKDDIIQATKSRLTSLEQQMNSMQFHHHHIKEENAKLLDLLRKVTFQNDRMADELENYVDENKKLRDKISQKIIEENDNILKARKSQMKHKSPISSVKKRKDMKQLSNGECNQNNDSILKLREDLQESIIEAKKLLSSKPLQIVNDDNNNSTDSSRSTGWKPEHLDKTRKCSISDQDQNISTTNNSNNNCSGSDNPDSSTLNTKRSESASLTEVDRHLNLPPIKRSDNQVDKDSECRGSIEKLLSSDSKKKPDNYIVKRSCRDSFELEEKIKRLLSTEN